MFIISKSKYINSKYNMFSDYYIITKMLTAI